MLFFQFLVLIMIDNIDIFISLRHRCCCSTFHTTPASSTLIAERNMPTLVRRYYHFACSIAFCRTTFISDQCSNINDRITCWMFTLKKHPYVATRSHMSMNVTNPSENPTTNKLVWCCCNGLQIIRLIRNNKLTFSKLCYMDGAGVFCTISFDVIFTFRNRLSASLPVMNTCTSL